MLKIPSFRKIDDITVYQDDEVWYRFYLLPSMPSIRRDAEGRPVFLLAIYHFSEQARAENPEIGRGGGYMNLDVRFAVEDEKIEEARSELQTWVDGEWERGQSVAELADQPGYDGAAPPKVEFADPLLSGGTVSMLTTQSDALVTGRFAEAPASLVSGSTAVFNVDLTEMGASFMKGLMVDAEGEGTIDLTPIQVIYDLRMWARLPPVTIDVVGKSERVHKTLQKISESNRDDPCTSREVETYRENGVNSSSLVETGSVEVTIDDGDANLPDEIVESLRQYALDLFDTMVEKRFLVPAGDVGPDLEFDDDAPEVGGNVDQGWVARLYPGENYRGEPLEVPEDMATLGGHNRKVSSIQVRAGHRVTLYRNPGHRGGSKSATRSTKALGPGWNNQAQSVRVWRPPTTRYKVRETLDESRMDLRIHIERSQVVEWPTGGQATLQTFFADASASEIERHVVDVHDDLFQSLRVEPRAFADFEGGRIAAVAVELEYPVGAPANEVVTETITLPADAGDLFDPSVVDGLRDYRYRYQVIYGDGTSSPHTAWEVTRTRDLNISVVDACRISLQLSGSTLNWEIVRTAVVELTYAEEGHTPKTVTRELTEVAPNKTAEISVNRDLGGELTARVTYHLVDEKVVEADPEPIDVTETLFVVPPPQADILDVTLVPTGDWSEVAQVVVSLEYDFGDGRVLDATPRLTSIENGYLWQVLLRDPNRRSFRYRTLISYTNGEAEQSDWVTEEGDQALPIKVQGVPKLEVAVNAAVVDFDEVQLVTVSLRHGSSRDTLSFTTKETKTWKVPLEEGEDGAYSYTVTWHPADGPPIEQGPTRGVEKLLVVPRLPSSGGGEASLHVRGFAVDFAATPFVDVEVVWTGPDGEERELVVLSADANTAVLERAIGADRSYRYEVTYNLADGSRVPGPSGTSDDPVVSVPAHAS